MWVTEVGKSVGDGIKAEAVGRVELGSGSSQELREAQEQWKLSPD